MRARSNSLGAVVWSLETTTTHKSDNVERPLPGNLNNTVERRVVAGSGCSLRSLGHPLARRAAPQPTTKSTLARQIDEFVAVFAVAREMIPEREMIRPQKVDIETIDVAGRR